jgi:hypothetical protein
MIFIISVLITSIGSYNFLNKDEVISFQIIEDKQHLSASLINWLNEINSDKGNHLYFVQNANHNEFLFYSNKNKGKNLYLTSTLKVKVENGSLILDIREKDAVNDEYVNDEVTAYFMIKKTPTEIKLYRNGKKENYKLEKGTFKIFK